LFALVVPIVTKGLRTCIHRVLQGPSPRAEVQVVKRFSVALVSATLLASMLQVMQPAGAGADPTTSLDVNRSVEAVVMTGQQLPSWSTTPAQGVANPYPCGSGDGSRGAPLPSPGCDTSSSFRDAHNGTY